jgi:hypothetical protein
MVITQEPTQSLAALHGPLAVAISIPREQQDLAPFPGDSIQHGNARRIRSGHVATSAHRTEPPWTGTLPSPIVPSVPNRHSGSDYAPATREVRRDPTQLSPGTTECIWHRDHVADSGNLAAHRIPHAFLFRGVPIKVDIPLVRIDASIQVNFPVADCLVARLLPFGMLCRSSPSREWRTSRPIAVFRLYQRVFAGQIAGCPHGHPLSRALDRHPQREMPIPLVRQY